MFTEFSCRSPTALIRAKISTNCDAHLAESLFQTRSTCCHLGVCTEICEAQNSG
ncbi:MAG: DUF6783 domain-containing protein [Blautia wexlerae]